MVFYYASIYRYTVHGDGVSYIMLAGKDRDALQSVIYSFILSD